MTEPMSDRHFKLMSLFFRFRDFFLPPAKILQEAKLKTGYQMLDFGCGPGSFSLAAARLVGKSGKVYALDIHPFAIRSVKRKSLKEGLQNIETISSDCATGLPNLSIDVVLLYDVFHELRNPDAVLAELSRVLKPEGTLLVSDHHLKKEEIISALTSSGFFNFLQKGNKTYTFCKI